MESLDHLIGRIYDAVLDEAALQEVPEAIARIAKGRSCLIVQRASGSPVQTFAYNNFSDDQQAQYVAHFSADDPWMIAASTQAANTAQSLDRHVPLAQWRRSWFYNEFAKPNGLADLAHCLAVSLTLGRDGVAVLGIQRDHRRGSFGRAEESLIQQAVPHMRRLLLLRTRLDVTEDRARDANAMFDMLATGVVLVDADGRVHFANVTARRFMGSRDGILELPGGYLSAERHADAIALRSEIRRAATGPGGGAVQIRRSSGASALQVLTTPLHWPEEKLTRKVMLVLHDPDSDPRELAVVLMQLFNLSLGEAQVALAVAQGSSLHELAEARGVRLSTVQTQLKRALDKTGQRKQSGLVRVISRVPTLRGGESG